MVGEFLYHINLPPNLQVRVSSPILLITVSLFKGLITAIDGSVASFTIETGGQKDHVMQSASSMVM